MVLSNGFSQFPIFSFTNNITKTSRTMYKSVHRVALFNKRQKLDINQILMNDEKLCTNGGISIQCSTIQKWE